MAILILELHVKGLFAEFRQLTLQGNTGTEPGDTENLWQVS